MMKTIKDWILGKIISIAIAIHTVEKTTISQATTNQTENIKTVDSETLLFALKHGIVNKELRFLRWRMYKILNYIDGKNLKNNNKLKKVKAFKNIGDEIRMVINNKTNFDSENKIITYRDFIPRFNIDKYIKKIIIKNNNDKTYIDMYISTYTSDNDGMHKAFLRQLEQAVENPIAYNLFNIEAIEFTTNKDLGDVNGIKHIFTDMKYHSYNAFDGNHVITFSSEKELTEDSIFEIYREIELDNLYEKNNI